MFRTIAAAVLVATLPLPVFAFEGWGGFYAEVYGGGHLGTPSSFAAPPQNFDMNAGPTFGASFGVVTSVPGLAFEVDVMRTSSEYTNFPTGFLHTLSFMANGEFSVEVTDAFDLYGLLGAGVIQIHYDYPVIPFEAVGWGAGYQAGAGVRVNATEHIAVFGEYKFQNTFQIVDTGQFSYGMPTHNIVGGVRVSME